MAPKKRIAIVGAGASGLPAIRHSLLYNLDVTCFEGSGYVGGLWRYKPEETDESSVMKTTVINTSKEMTAYSDFPPPAHMANFMHNTEMYKYLQLYADEFNLTKYIKFHHRVTNVERSDSYKKDGTWKVSYTDEQGNDASEIFDSVLICSGHHAEPHFPKKWPGQDTFTGKTIHSHSYKDHRGYEDKVVVVVGVGNSGGDVAVELSRIAKQVYLVTRRGCWVMNRIYDRGVPADLALNNQFLFTLKHFVPEKLSSKFMEHKLNTRFDHERYGLKPKHHFFGAHPTVNDELPNRIACGTVRIKPNIRKFNGNNLEFEDGSVVENVDDLILCTGFSFGFPILENGKLIPVSENKVDLYQNMYPVETFDHNSMAVIGLVQPFGSIMPISEMQARLFLENLYGRPRLPPVPEMKEDIRKKREAMSKRYVESRRHTIQIDYVDYMTEMAHLVGCFPDFKELLFKDPVLVYHTFFGPHVSYIYRLFGPHQWKGARRAILDLDERVFKGTNSGPYTSSNSNMVIGAAIILLFALSLVFIM